MGKRLKSQKRGKGSPKYRASKKAFTDVSYINADKKQLEDVIRGEVRELVNDSGRSAVVAQIVFEDGRNQNVIAAEGLSVGQTVEYGSKAELRIGNVLQLGNIIEGCPIFNVEKTMGDGGTMIRSSGIYGLVLSKEKKKVYIKLPSGRMIAIKPDCRATIGCAAGGGRLEKPFVKAGAKYHAMRARGRPYPTLRGVAMNPVDHPFGGSQHHAGKSKSVSRHSPPGAKVGAIASKRTGRKKR